LYLADVIPPRLFGMPFAFQESMLKIAVTEQSAQGATLQLEGVVTGPWVEELRTTCESALGATGP